MKNKRKPVQHYYPVTFDPLDGSSNMDINVSVGIIFSIMKVPEGVKKPTAADFW